MVQITTEKINGVYELKVVGEVDASSSIHLDNAISHALEEGNLKIMINCLELNYISSAGLGVFMSYLDDFKNKGIGFVIYGLQQKVNHVFELIGLENLITIVNNQEEALAYLDGPQA